MTFHSNYSPLFCAIVFGLISPTVAADETSQVQTFDETESLVVYGRALSLYRAQESSLATKIPTAIDETPQSIQVLTQPLIQDQGARQITDLYRSISGVSQYSYSGVTFRGFRQDHILYRMGFAVIPLMVLLFHNCSI
nr:TonB-dependent receptor plug domain-containing protein [Vibrio cincinnatiensis]